MIRWLWNKMMKWGWDFNRDRGRDIPIELCSNSMNGNSNVRIGIFAAMNGKVLEISKRDRNHDYTYSYFLVPENITLTDAVTTFLIAEGLNG